MLRLARPLIAAAMFMVLTLLGGVAVAPAHAAARNSAGPLLWTVPTSVDTSPIDAMACPSTRLCVAVDRSGKVLWSTSPAGGSRTWRAARVDGGNELTGVACPSTGLCVAVDGVGNVITSQDPTGGQPAWAVAKIDSSQTQANTDTIGPVLLRGLSCPSTGLCVAVDSVGNAVVSTNPTGGTAAWFASHADVDRRYACSGSGLTCQPPLMSVSCPSIQLCAAVDFSGNILTTANPTAAGPWSSTASEGNRLGSLWGISCPSVSFCATVDGAAGHVITFDLALTSARRSRSLPGAPYGIWCQSPSLCLASEQTPNGLSGLLGSYDPAVRASTWSPSSLGAVDAVTCPSASLCLAGDGQGDVAAGLTTHAIASLLSGDLLRTRRPPTIASLDRTRQARFAVTSPIAARVTLVWTVPGRRPRTQVMVGSARHRFTTPGRAALTLRLTPAGIRLFRVARRRVTVTATATFAAGTGSLRKLRRATFTHPPGPKKPRHKRHR